LTFDASGVITSATNNAVSVANTAITGNIISSQITSVANTQITGNIISSQISPSVTLTTPIISGNLNLDSAGTTGIRVPSANTIAFYGAGTEDVRIDSSGNMGIGITPPAWAGFKVLDIGSVTSLWAIGSGAGTSYYSNNLYYNGGARIYKTTGEASEYTQGGGTHQWYTAGSGTAGDSVTLAERARISGADFLVGATSTSGLQTATSGGFVTDGKNYLWVVRSGGGGSTVDIGRTSGAGTGNYIEFWYQGTNTGTVSTNGSTTTYGTSSDYRLKENIVPMTGALATVAQLKPCTYKWKVDGSNGQGFIAHELQEVVPDCVTGEKDAVETYLDDESNEQTRIKPQGIDTSFLVATLTAAIQELKAINDTQAETINTLSSTITALTARVAALES
jgi:hypothetical protein